MLDIELCAWKYLENTRNYPGVHLVATPKACDVLLECLTNLQCRDTSKPAILQLKTLDPQWESQISGGLQFQDFARLTIHYRPATIDLQQMCISEIKDEVVIEITAIKIQALRSGIEEMKKGNGDFSIGPRQSQREGLILGNQDKKSLSLWFWWGNSNRPFWQRP